MKRYIGFYSITGLVFFLYMLICAITVEVTYDEAWTFMDFVPLSVWHVINCTPCDANNHLINTLLIKLVYLFTPESLFWARVPNVAAGLLYIFIGYKISTRFLPLYFGYAFFLLLLANPFLMDFFSLARGYGLSIAFMLTSVYCLLLFRESGKLLNSFWATGWASLAVLSNYALLNYWCGAIFVLFLIPFKSGFERKALFGLTGACLCLELCIAGSNV